MGQKDKMMLARYWTGGEVGAAQYWKGKDERMCRVCREHEETLQYVMEQCGAMKDSLKNKMGEVLSEDGGERWRLREIDKEKRSKYKE